MNKTAITASAFLGLFGGAFIAHSPRVEAGACSEHVSASTSTCSTCDSGSGSDDCRVSICRVWDGSEYVETSCCWDQGNYCY
jgi:hypothetical protein